jgi:transcriptional regulator with XRE-family HTH domain
MREARLAHGLGVRQLADLVGLSAQMLSQWERGTRVPTVAQVALILGFLQMRGKQREHILELARTAREPDWITHAGLSTLLQCEQDAVAITNWALAILPGLLQTADYARVIFLRSALPANEIDKRLVARLNRQKMLTRSKPIRFTAILNETVLHEMVGNEDVMSDQMDHLLAVSDRPHVSVRVMPSGDYHPGRAGSFMTFEYSASQPIVLLEHHRTGVFLAEPEKVAAFREVTTLLKKRALSEEASRELIAGLAR